MNTEVLRQNADMPEKSVYSMWFMDQRCDFTSQVSQTTDDGQSIIWNGDHEKQE